jgi:hypothetical protein
VPVAATGTPAIAARPWKPRASAPTARRATARRSPPALSAAACRRLPRAGKPGRFDKIRRGAGKAEKRFVPKNRHDGIAVVTLRGIDPVNFSSFPSPATATYAKAIANSQRVRWEIDRDVIRGRRFAFDKAFLPAGLSLVDELGFLEDADRRAFSHVQGRTYAYLFGLVERYIAAKTLQLGTDHTLGDQVAFEALVRMTDEELKHQELFRRLDALMETDMPPGYLRTADPNGVAEAVLSRRTWAVLALTLHIELFTLAHYRASIEPQDDVCPLWKDVFLNHWREESQHAVLDELEFLREDARLTAGEREAAVDDLIALVGAVDGILQAQAEADARYFASIASRRFDHGQREAIGATFLKAYRWQYIVSGVLQPRFQKVLFGTLDDAQQARILAALAPLLAAAPAQPSPVVA